MICRMYNTASEKNKVDKALTLVKEISTFKIKDNCSIIRPVLIVSKNAVTLTNGALFNYAYIDVYNRYYFVTDIKTVANGMVEISCAVDVLMSFNTAIKNLDCIIERQEKVYNAYLTDGLFTAYNYSRVQTKEFPSGFTAETKFVLATVGGGD